MSDHDRELVNISPPALLAAARASGWTNQALARAIDELPQTIDNLMKGKELKQCQRGRRQKLAKKLKVPEEWLGSAQQQLPGFQHLPYNFTSRLSPAEQLRISNLVQRVEKRVAKDAVAAKLSADRHKAVLGMTLFMMTELMRAWRWREQLTTWRPPFDADQQDGEALAGTLESPGDHDADRERVGLAMIEILETALAPWLDRNADLDYARLRAIAGCPAPRPKSYRRYKGQATTPLEILPQYATGELKP